MTNPLQDVLKSKVILIIGTNTTSNHPIIANYIYEAVQKHGARLIVIDPRKIQLVGISNKWLRHKLGTDVALINGLMHVIIRENLQAQTYIDERTTGFEDLRACVANIHLSTSPVLQGFLHKTLLKWLVFLQQRVRARFCMPWALLSISAALTM